MKRCENYAALLDAFLDGELTPEEMADVQAHLDACPACRQYVDDGLAIRAAFPSVEETDVPEGFAEAVCAAIQAGAAARKRKTPWGKVLAPLAACCAVVILLAGSLRFGSGSGMDAAYDTTGNASGMGDAQTYQATCDSAEDASERSAAPESGDGGAPAVCYAAAPEAEKQEALDAAPSEHDAAYQEDCWILNDNVVFAGTVFLTPEYVGDALDGYEGKPFSNAIYPEEDVIGTGYALEQEDFERILYDELHYPLGPMLVQDRTTDLSCIVVTDDSCAYGPRAEE